MNPSATVTMKSSIISKENSRGMKIVDPHMTATDDAGDCQQISEKGSDQGTH